MEARVAWKQQNEKPSNCVAGSLVRRARGCPVVPVGTTHLLLTRIRGTGWRFLVVLALTPSVVLAAGDGDVGESVRNAVVKVYVSSQAPDQQEPWKGGPVYSYTGSGCVLEGQRILTAAHVVSRQTYLQVRRQGETRKHDARVLFVAHEVDLALLAVDDPGFFAGIEPLALAPLPATQRAVVALGFPSGGDTLSLTKGVVSRIEHLAYVHSGGAFLAMQVDAAINPGNSGGPVVDDQRLVGVAMQTRGDLQNISYVVPSPVIRRFLDDVADGAYDGVPQLGITWQPLENRAMRRRFGVEPGVGGVLVTAVAPGSGAGTVLEPRDVLLSIDGTAIAEDGTVEFRPGERTSFSNLVDGRQRGGVAKVAFVRDGQRRQALLQLTARYGYGDLVPPEDHEADPRYFIFGGLLLRPVGAAYVHAFAPYWWRDAPNEFLVALSKMGSFEGEEVVALARIFPDEVNEGYQDFGLVVVTAIDGVRPRNFLHAVDLVEKGSGAFLTLDLSDARTVVVDRAVARAHDSVILQRYHIPFDRSADLRDSSARQRAGRVYGGSRPAAP